MTLRELLDELNYNDELDDTAAKKRIILVDEWDDERYEIDGVEESNISDRIYLRFNSYGK